MAATVIRIFKDAEPSSAPRREIPTTQLHGWGHYPVVEGRQLVSEDLEEITAGAALSRGSSAPRPASRCSSSISSPGAATGLCPSRLMAARGDKLALLGRGPEDLARSAEDLRAFGAAAVETVSCAICWPPRPSARRSSKPPPRSAGSIPSS